MAFLPNSANRSGWQFRSLTRPITRFASHVQAEWRHRRTERMLEALPAEIRKDIGWPTSDYQGSANESLH